MLAGEARVLVGDWAGRSYGSVEVRRFSVKMGSGMGYWFTFLTVPGVGLMNNRAVWALREFVVQRRIMGVLQER